MAIITFEVYRTQVTSGNTVGTSQRITLNVNDANNDGVLSEAEIVAALVAPGTTATTANTFGEVVGDVTLFVRTSSGSANGVNANASGYLFTPDPIAPGNVGSILTSLGGTFLPFEPANLRICFATGTLIGTPNGPRAVEDLCAGELVLTADGAARQIVWTGSRDMDAAALDLSPNQRPVLIGAGALGGGLPLRDLVVSPQHRILMHGLPGDEGQGVLVAARHLAESGMAGVRVMRGARAVTYHHIALADHDLLLAEGAAVESLFIGPQALRALTPAQRAELTAVFPSLAQGRNPMTPVRPFARRRDIVPARRHERADA